jgi:WD40 repeat protein
MKLWTKQGAALGWAAIGFGALAASARAENAPAALDFYKDIHPFLETNCVPCHNKTTTKAKLNLESPALLRKGGESGPGAIPGNGAESLVFQSAAHQGDSVMPPKDNKSGAVNLNPEQLAVLRSWIDQGAKDSTKRSQTVALRPLPKGTQPIRSVAMTTDGRFAACGRGDRLFLYDLAAKELAATFSDPSLKSGAAHMEMIHSLDFSSDGNFLASGGFREAKIWRRESGGMSLTTLDGIAASARLALSPDGKRVLVAQPGADARVVGLEKGAVPVVLEGFSSDALGAFCFSPEGGSVALYLQRGSVGIFSAVSGKEQRRLQAPSGVRTLGWSGDGAALVFGTGASVQIWSAEAGALEREIKVAAPQALALSKDGKTLAVACSDSVVRLFNFATGVAGPELKLEPANTAKVAECESRAARAGLDVGFHAGVIAQVEAQNKTLELHEKKAKERIAAAQKALPEKQKSLAPAQAARAEAEKAANEIDAALKAELKPLPATLAKQKEAITKLAGAVTAANSAASAVESAQNHITDGEQQLQQITEARNANESRRTAADKAQKAAAAVQAEELKQAAALKQPVAPGGTPQVLAVAFSQNGKWISAVCADGGQPVWSADSGTFVETFSVGGAPGAASLVGVGADQFVSLTDNGTLARAGVPRVWTLFKTLGGGGAESPLVDRVCAVRFSPDGRRLATGGGEASRSGDVHIWDVASGRLEQTWAERHADTVLALDFSPDGKWLASGGADRLARVAEVDGGKSFLTMEGHTHHVLGVAFRADARLLATAGGDGVVNVWSTESGERSKKIIGWSKEVTGLQFQGATNTIVTSAADNQVRMVKDDGTEVRAMAKLPDFIQAAACAPQRSWIVGGGEDSVLRLWDGASGAELAAFQSP